MSNLNKWAPWYAAGAADDSATRYTDSVTYEMAADWLEGLDVEDWGAGYAWYRRYHRGGTYVAIDGTPGFCDVVADLTTYRSTTDGLMMRHVLEHDWGWRDILRNAIASCVKRMVLVTFIPNPGREEQQVGFTDELGVPDIAIPHHVIRAAFRGWRVDKTYVDTMTAFGGETVWRAERR